MLHFDRHESKWKSVSVGDLSAAGDGSRRGAVIPAPYTDAARRAVLLVARCRIGLARVQRQMGQPDAVSALVREAAEMLESMGLTQELARLRDELAAR